MLNKFKNTKAYLDNYSKELVKLLKIEIGRNRTRSYSSGRSYNSPIDNTGSLRESIESLAKESANGFGFNIMANEYGLAVDKGTKQGQPPVYKPTTNIQDLMQWIRSKPVRIRDSKGRFVQATDYRVRGLAFVIARKIGRDGIEATGFIQDAINQSMEKLNKLGEVVSQDVSLNLDDILIKSGYIKKGDNYILKQNE
jgi:hypothetical protein